MANQWKIFDQFLTISDLDLITKCDFLPKCAKFATYATGAACQQRKLTPPDTWSCPTLGLACVLMSRQISPELVLSPDFWISNIPRYFSFAEKRLISFFFSMRKSAVQEITNLLFWYQTFYHMLYMYVFTEMIETNCKRNDWIFHFAHWKLSSLFLGESKIEKVPRGIRGEKSSKDMASSRNLVSTIGALASPKMGDGTRCTEG